MTTTNPLAHLKKLPVLLILGALSLLPNTSGLAEQANSPTNTTYYVSSSVGSDQADGHTPRTAWRTLDRVNSASLKPGDRVLFQRDNLWRGQLLPQSGADGKPVTYGAFGKGAKPILQAAVAKDKPDDWLSVENNLWTTRPPANTNNATLDVDVGNIILDHGVACGVKKWRREDLLRNGDFWYDPAARQVWLYSDTTPTKQHHSIELALKKHIINETGCSHVTYEDLQLRYGAAHGIGGGNTSHITVRRCDIYFIGGGLLKTSPDGKPVRFGNGIEFWNAGKHNLVENCRLWEIYDAALTNQGKDPKSEQVNITYRHNVIWNSEYSFEYWNRTYREYALEKRPETARTENILFEHNTCLDAGYGWGHNQRPDKNGCHLKFGFNAAITREVVVRNNIFCNATDSGLIMRNDWRTGLTLDRNLWFQKTGLLFTFLRRNFTADQLEDYRTATGFDLRSVIATPTFRNATQRDYRLAPGSPGLKWTAEGQSCGANFIAE